MKCLNVTKLELQAAILAARLKFYFKRALAKSLNRIFMWTDSNTVIH